MEKGKYAISAICSPFGEPTGETIYEDKPEMAVLRWCELSEKYPTCTSLQPQTKEDGMDLLKWVKLNFEKVATYMSLHKCPYKTEWVKEQVESQLSKGKCSMQWERDELYPFCMG